MREITAGIAVDSGTPGIEPGPSAATGMAYAWLIRREEGWSVTEHGRA
ncbi:hypothetical protein ACFRFC_23330 [Streptomyces sp. NPDC056734]